MNGRSDQRSVWGNYPYSSFIPYSMGSRLELWIEFTNHLRAPKKIEKQLPDTSCPRKKHVIFTVLFQKGRQRIFFNYLTFWNGELVSSPKRYKNCFFYHQWMDSVVVSKSLQFWCQKARLFRRHLILGFHSRRFHTINLMFSAAIQYCVYSIWQDCS